MRTWGEKYSPRVTFCGQVRGKGVQVRTILLLIKLIKHYLTAEGAQNVINEATRMWKVIQQGKIINIEEQDGYQEWCEKYTGGFR